MHRRFVSVPLSVAALTIGLATSPVASAADAECGIILPAADLLESEFNAVAPSGTPTYVAGLIRSALAPLYGLSSAAAVDLRIRSDNVASQIDGSDPYRTASPERLASELGKARQQLDTSRAFCAS